MGALISLSTIRIVGRLFMVGDLSKISATMVGRRRKILKLHWQNALKQSQKIKFGPKNKARSFTNLDSLNILKNILPQHSQKPCFWLVSEKLFALHNF